jgi:acyl carrier protein
VTRDQLRETVVRTLADIAPEIDGTAIGGSVPLREQVDLDSFDFLRFVIALHERLGVEIPEADYGQLSTLDGIVDYLAAQCPSVSDSPTP